MVEYKMGEALIVAMMIATVIDVSLCSINRRFGSVRICKLCINVCNLELGGCGGEDEIKN